MLLRPASMTIVLMRWHMIKYLVIRRISWVLQLLLTRFNSSLSKRARAGEICFGNRRGSRGCKVGHLLVLRRYLHKILQRLVLEQGLGDLAKDHQTHSWLEHRRFHLHIKTHHNLHLIRPMLQQGLHLIQMASTSLKIRILAFKKPLHSQISKSNPKILKIPTL